MSAEILILPIVRIERDDEAKAVVVKLTRRDYWRLGKLASAWNVPIDEAASMMLSRELGPVRRK
jgi:hypothetical protein